MKKKLHTLSLLFTTALFVAVSMSAANALDQTEPSTVETYVNKQSEYQDQIKKYKKARTNWKDIRKKHTDNSSEASEPILVSEAKVFITTSLVTCQKYLELYQSRIEFIPSVSDEVKAAAAQIIADELAELDSYLAQLGDETSSYESLVELSAQIQQYWREAERDLEYISARLLLDRIRWAQQDLLALVSKTRLSFETGRHTYPSDQVAQLDNDLNKIELRTQTISDDISSLQEALDASRSPGGEEAEPSFTEETSDDTTVDDDNTSDPAADSLEEAVDYIEIIDDIVKVDRDIMSSYELIQTIIKPASELTQDATE